VHVGTRHIFGWTVKQKPGRGVQRQRWTDLIVWGRVLVADGGRKAWYSQCRRRFAMTGIECRGKSASLQVFRKGRGLSGMPGKRVGFPLRTGQPTLRVRDGPWC